MKTSFMMMAEGALAVLLLSGCWPSSSVTRTDADLVEITAEISAQIGDVQPKADAFCAESGKQAYFQSSSCYNAACLEEVYRFSCR